MATTAKKTASGSYEVFRDGKRVSTTSASGLKGFGLSEQNLGGGAPSSSTSSPAPQTGFQQLQNQGNIDYGNVNNNAQSEAAYQAEQRRIAAERAEAQRQSKLVSDAKAVTGAGGGSFDIQKHFGSLNAADQKIVTDSGAFGSNATQPPIDTDFLSQFLSPSQIQGIKDAQRTVASMGDAPTVPRASTGAVPSFSQPNASSIQDAYRSSLNSNVETSRQTLETAYQTQITDSERKVEETNKSLEELSTLEAEGVKDVQKLMQPFRDKLVEAEQERLFINENFQANQKLVNELGTLLQEGNELIEQQKAQTGLGAIRNPRIAKTISDVNARAGVIQAVIQARDGQINQAYNMIDRTIEAINADKQDQLDYYDTLFDFYSNQKDVEGKKLIALTADKQDFLNAQIGLLENDLERAQETADYVKELMLDPETAGLMADAGVTLNDTIEEIITKRARQEQYNAKVEASTGGGSTTTPTTDIKMSTSDKNSLLGAGFLSEEVSEIEEDVNEYGVEAVLEGIDNEAQKKAIRKVYDVPEKITRAQIESSVNQDILNGKVDIGAIMENYYTESELKGFAKAAGFTKGGFLGIGVGKKGLAEYLDSPAAREKYTDILVKQYKDAGMMTD